MTGFAKKQCILNNRRYTIEIKTLNSKALDLIVKVPASLRTKELEIRSMLNKLERGKIDVIITEECDKTSAPQLNRELVISRFNELTQLIDTLKCSDNHIFETIIGMNDVWLNNETDDITDKEWALMVKTFEEAIVEVDDFRKHEGMVLKQDFVKHIDLIEQKLQAIPQYEGERIETAKERILHYFADAAIKEIDKNRFEQELIYYLEKLDITEEKIRLAKHIDYFRHTMEEEEGSGKKLGFVAQEMGREINTTGSKANHVEIQKIVVEMKDELEKIKEQLGNIL